MKNKDKVIIKGREGGFAELELRREIGKMIQGVRRRHNITAEVLAKSLGIKRGALTQIETGRNNISAVLVWEIAARLRCKVENFFPIVPIGYELAKTDLDMLSKVDERAAIWAGKIFKKYDKKN